MSYIFVDMRLVSPLFLLEGCIAALIQIAKLFYVSSNTEAKASMSEAGPIQGPWTKDNKNIQEQFHDNHGIRMQIQPLFDFL